MIRRAAFTLIELLFVVAIIGVLAAISVPNFLEAQTRAKLGRTKADMAVLAMGLNRYYTDYGAYPPNTPEVQQYLEAALINPVMDTTHTSTPKDAKWPWYPDPLGVEITTESSSPMGMGMMGMSTNCCGEDSDSATSGGEKLDYVFPARYNMAQLYILTTPISYLGSALPKAIFSRYGRYEQRPTPAFDYVNTGSLFTDDTPTSTPGLRGDHVTSSTYFYLVSEGPSANSKIWHPLSGPFTSYDATNGTMSEGDLYYFEGYKPGVSPTEEKYRPDFIQKPYDSGDTSWQSRGMAL